MIEVTLMYRRKLSIETVVSEYLSEDVKYVFLKSGRYVKARILSITTRQVGDDDDEE